MNNIIKKTILTLTRTLPDELYLRMAYKIATGKTLHLNPPITFNEKLQWLKLNDRKPEYTMMVDKYAVKKYVADIIGEEYIIPTLGVWDNADDIDFDSLPDKFVLKCNHNSSMGICICKDKSILNYDKVIHELNKGLNDDYYSHGREWPYKNVPRKIIAEQYLEDSTCPNSDLTDYKFYCFNGEAKYCQIIRDRRTNKSIDFYDMNWKHQNFVGLTPQCTNGNSPVDKPNNLHLMIEICEKLSKNIPFVRVDLYYINGNVYFGELTFFPGTGFGKWTPDSFDKEIGEWLNIDQI